MHSVLFIHQKVRNMLAGSVFHSLNEFHRWEHQPLPNCYSLCLTCSVVIPLCKSHAAAA
jgi:hypothetical protein